MHYGRIPERDPEDWVLTIGGATADAREHVLTLAELTAMPHQTQVRDMHCATAWSARGVRWGGVAVQSMLHLCPPADDVTEVLVFAEFGYAANVAAADFLADDALLATHLDDEPLAPERGAPLRLVIPHLYTWKQPKWLRGWNYLRPGSGERGFWEQRGYHLRGDAWAQQRYAERR